MKDKKLRLLLATVLAMVFSQMAAAADLYVATNGTGDGSTWAKATNSIQGAIDAIAANITNTVWVSNGVYQTGGLANYPTGEILTNRVVIDKAITVRSANNDPANTIIKGAWDPATNGPAAVRCVYMSAGILIGFTLTNGATLGSGTYARAGGLFGGTASNCILTGNSAADYGGAAYGCTLYNCMIVGNRAVSTGGGGMQYGTLYNCTIVGNRSISGGGVQDSTMYNCLLIGNKANTGGGVRYTQAGKFMYNCTLVGNQASDNAGGVYNSASEVLIVNCIIYSNDALTSASNWYGTISFTNSCTTPEYAGWAPGNITNDPIFVANGNGFGTNHVAGNYRLRANSPCVNKGINYSWMTDPANPRSKDLDGHSRIDKFSGRVDIGCYEYLPSGTIFSAR